MQRSKELKGKLFFSIAALLFLGGCASVPQIPPELQYNPPVGPIDSLATLEGFQEDSTVLDDLTAYVLTIDGKRVVAGRDGWSRKLLLQPGSRIITVAFQRGIFYTQTDLLLDARIGGQYQVQFTSDVEIFGTNSFCDFWIVDVGTRKAVTEIRRGMISGRATMVPLFIPTYH